MTAHAYDTDGMGFLVERLDSGELRRVARGTFAQLEPVVDLHREVPINAAVERLRAHLPMCANGCGRHVSRKTSALCFVCSDGRRMEKDRERKRPVPAGAV